MYFLIISLVCVLAYYFVQKLRNVRTYKIPPNYPGWLPLIGHCHLFVGRGQENLWSFIQEIFRKCLSHGDVLKVSLGLQDMFLITDPDDASTVVNTCFDKHYMYKFTQPWLGNGLLTAGVPLWKKNRKLMNQAFTHQALVGYLSVFNSQGRRLLTHLDTQVGKRFDPEPLLVENNLEIICQTALAVDPDAHSRLLVEYSNALRTVFDTVIERFMKFWLHSGFIFSMSYLKVKQMAAIKDLHNLSNTMLQKRKSELTEAMRNHEILKGNFRPIIDTLLEAAIKENSFTDQQMREEVDTIILGGHDTSSTTLTFVLILLGSYPDVQEKAYNEIIQVVGDSMRDFDNVDLNKLVYIDCILKETIRLYPIAPVIARYAQNDVKLKNYTIPAGNSLTICSWAIHRHPIWGSDPDTFRPERWLDSAALPGFHKAFYGFSLGKRGCIGKTYAMMSMKIAVSLIVRRYKIKADILKLKLKMNAFLRPVSGSDIVIELRN